MEKTDNQKKSREFSGIVSSTAMAKTITVVVSGSKEHPKYHKRYKTSEKYHVHDEKKLAKVGDLVRFAECRPLSATKKWRLIEVLKA